MRKLLMTIEADKGRTISIRNAGGVTYFGLRNVRICKSELGLYLEGEMTPARDPEDPGKDLVQLPIALVSEES